MTQRTHLTVERTPGIGEAIGQYRIVGLVGSVEPSAPGASNGSLGALYIAEQRGIRGVSKTVALRVIRSELAQSQDFRALFFDASSIAPRCEHPNVVSVHEMGEAGGRYFVSMEYLAGESVASILTRCSSIGPVPPDLAAAVVKQAANGVQYLHDRRAAAMLPVGLGPGQLNVGTVFVTYHGTVKLLSIGLEPIRLVEPHAASGEHKVHSSSQAGTYAAPEHSQGVIDRRTDVFNLGVVLWTCLTGRRPRVAPGEAESVTPSQRLEPPSSVRADVPRALEAIAVRALSPDPRERFQSARAMSDALDQYLLQGASRPTPKHLRRWLEQLFDVERASLKLQLAQGRDVEAALSRLGSPQPGSLGAGSVRRSSGTSPVVAPRARLRPRELWSTSHSVFSRLPRPESESPPRSFEQAPGVAFRERLPHERLSAGSILVRRTPALFAPSKPPAVPPAAPPLGLSELPNWTPPRARPPRTWLVGATLLTCALIALGTVVLLSSSDESSPFRDTSRDGALGERSGRVDVRSTPEGAAVFIDGEPSGLRTPLVLKGLAAGRKVRLRVEKAGFARQERELTVVAGSVQTQAFELVASVGLVHFTGAPADGRVYVDDVLVDVEGKKRVTLSVGPHTVRVETPGSLIFSGTVVIVAGEQTIRVDGEPAAP